MNPITKEQADFILNEILKHAYNNTREGEDIFSCGKIKKALEKCINMPPEDGYITNTNSGGFVKLFISPDNEALVAIQMIFNGVKGAVAATDLDVKQLTDLRDNINRMLEYLNDSVI